MEFRIYAQWPDFEENPFIFNFFLKFYASLFYY